MFRQKTPVLVLLMALTLIPALAVSAEGPVHQVHVGTPDACVGFGLSPGCDANLSLTAIQHADGSVSGQYTDRWPDGNGFHAVIDCLYVDGNKAWVSGVITEGGFEEVDFAGLSVSTMVQDNGTSANDPPDQISFSWIGPPELGPLPAFDCQDHPDVPLFDAPQGQVIVN